MTFGITEALKGIEENREELKNLIKEQRLTNQLLKTLIILQNPEKKVDEILASLKQVEEEVSQKNIKF